MHETGVWNDAEKCSVREATDFEKGTHGLEAAQACERGVNDHAEGHDADPKTYANEDEVQEDYLQVQVTPSDCIVRRRSWGAHT